MLKRKKTTRFRLNFTERGFTITIAKSGVADNPGGEISQPNVRSRHVAADEITWEQYVLEKCPCRTLESFFSET